MSRRSITLDDLGPSARRQVEDARIAETLREVAAKAEKPKRKHKYGAKACEVDGIYFPSHLEAKRYTELKLSERAGTITNLRRQVRYDVVVCGIAICTWIADFVYLDSSGKEIVEDAKGFATREYKMKSKLVTALFGITIQEVRK